MMATLTLLMIWRPFWIATVVFASLAWAQLATVIPHLPQFSLVTMAILVLSTMKRLSSCLMAVSASLAWAKPLPVAPMAAVNRSSPVTMATLAPLMM
jgi:hypothetical protein